MSADGRPDQRKEDRRHAGYAGRMRACIRARIDTGGVGSEERWTARAEALLREYDAACERWKQEDAPPVPTLAPLVTDRPRGPE